MRLAFGSVALTGRWASPGAGRFRVDVSNTNIDGPGRFAALGRESDWMRLALTNRDRYSPSAIARNCAISGATKPLSNNSGYVRYTG